MTISELKQLKETEDKVEFKAATHNFSFAGSEHREQEERRRCFLGYVVAFANEGGGMLVLGMADKTPHDVVGSDFANGKIGALEDETYSRLGIRVRMEELYENGLRVLVAHIPIRPVGKMLKFEGVPLMRVGESLRNMSDEEMFAILSEQEPDFSALACESLKLSDLDTSAIQILKEKYSEKQKNPSFLRHSTKQVLIDLKLLENNKLNNAALILLAKENVIEEKLPQYKTIIEYRSSSAQIEFNSRMEIQKPLFLAIDEIWEILNHPASNPNQHIQIGPYISDIQNLNEIIVREAILNAITHRDYRLSSNVVIKHFPDKLVIINPGGFPLGVNKDNLITISSTPRSKRLADILQKTGLVEKSGQGVDKLFLHSLSESKKAPDYSKSDDFQVSLELSTIIQDKAFAIFVNNMQKARRKNNKLGVFDLIVLDKIRQGTFAFSNAGKNPIVKYEDTYDKLLKEGLIERIGKSASTRYVLSKEYYRISRTDADIRGYRMSELSEIAKCFENSKTVKMIDFVKAFSNQLTRPQVKYIIDKLVADKILIRSGLGYNTEYMLNEGITKSGEILTGITELLKKGGFRQMSIFDL
ncbi:MAG TPA: ATP-binding protein [Prolixibacteraceae bacterium]|nr:ATP-binding protein [Prolixibacteraceae bacterium]